MTCLDVQHFLSYIFFGEPTIEVREENNRWIKAVFVNQCNQIEHYEINYWILLLIGKLHTDTPKMSWSHDLTLHIIIEGGSSIELELIGKRQLLNTRMVEVSLVAKSYVFFQEIQIRPMTYELTKVIF